MANEQRLGSESWVELAGVLLYGDTDDLQRLAGLAPEEQQREPVCCGAPMSADIHNRPYPDGHPFGSVEVEAEAAPSTDEGEAGWVRAEESPDFVVWRIYEGGFCTGATTLPKEVEAAICAPLEERIRDLHQNLVDTRLARAADDVSITILQAENERLREVLESIRAG